MKYRKFLITESPKTYKPVLLVGYVEYHSDLLKSRNQKCYGGGKYRFYSEHRRIEFYGSSDDYGSVKNVKIIKDALSNNIEDVINVFEITENRIRRNENENILSDGLYSVYFIESDATEHKLTDIKIGFW